MASGIWTPVYGSTKSAVFADRLSTLAAKIQTLALAAGTHMRITNMGCLPVFLHNAAPASDAAGLTGVPIVSNEYTVLPRIANIWIYSPYENSTIQVDIGTLTHT